MSTPDAGPERGYREGPERAIAEPPPEGELIEATPQDQRALESKRAWQRNRLVGMIVGVALVTRYAIPLVDYALPDSPWLIGALVLAAVALAGYALWSYLFPRDPGPLIVRVEPEDVVTAGRFLTITVLIEPRQALTLNPLQVQLVASRAGEGRKRPETTPFSTGILASRQTIEANRAVRLQTTLLVPQEAPPTSRKRGVTWRVEVSIGAPPVFTHRVAIRVLPLEKRLRERAERMKARAARS